MDKTLPGQYINLSNSVILHAEHKAIVSRIYSRAAATQYKL